MTPPEIVIIVSINRRSLEPEPINVEELIVPPSFVNNASENCNWFDALILNLKVVPLGPAIVINLESVVLLISETIDMNPPKLAAANEASKEAILFSSIEDIDKAFPFKSIIDRNDRDWETNI